MKNFPKSQGIIRYDPQRRGRSKEPWWIILECDKDLAAYQRCLASKLGIDLYAPNWGSHVSINRGVEPVHKKMWGKHEGEIIEFQYDPNCDTNGNHWWLHVYCDFFATLRDELGLPKEAHTKWQRFHLTIGKFIP